MRTILLCIFCLLLFSVALSQEYLIESPTSYIIPKDKVKFTFKVYPEMGTMIGRIDIGTFENFYIGLSYRVDSLIGYYNGAVPSNWLYWLTRKYMPGVPLVRWLPGVHARFRLLNEPISPVSAAIGIDLQTRGIEIPGVGYLWYIRPIYGVLGKGIVGKKCSAYVGAGYNGPFSGVMLEIHPMTFFIDWAFLGAWFETGEKRRQTLDVGMRWSPEPAISIELDVKNILESWGGAFKVTYTMSREWI